VVVPGGGSLGGAGGSLGGTVVPAAGWVAGWVVSVAGWVVSVADWVVPAAGWVVPAAGSVGAAAGSVAGGLGAGAGSVVVVAGGVVPVVAPVVSAAPLVAPVVSAVPLLAPVAVPVPVAAPVVSAVPLLAPVAVPVPVAAPGGSVVAVAAPVVLVAPVTPVLVASSPALDGLPAAAWSFAEAVEHHAVNRAPIRSTIATQVRPKRRSGLWLDESHRKNLVKATPSGQQLASRNVSLAARAECRPVYLITAGEASELSAYAAVLPQSADFFSIASGRSVRNMREPAAPVAWSEAVRPMRRSLALAQSPIAG
jgi:hypothetical protein